ncbi:MAG TPA: DNA repair protein RadC [Candidatus Limnocylindria bacterium]
MSALPGPILVHRGPPDVAQLELAELMAQASGADPALCGALLAADPWLVRLESAGPESLVAEHGLGSLAARRLVAAVALGRRLATLPAEPGWRIRSPADVGERLLPAMRHLEREELVVLLLNTKNVVTARRTVYAGNLAGSSVRVGEVYRDAVRRQAAALVVVHNHPSGDPTPSADDLRITAELAEAGRLLDIELLDHVVIGAEGWVSLRSLGATQESG